MDKLNSKSTGVRILAFFLAVLMMIPIVPMNVIAEDEVDTSEHVHTDACIESKTLICGYPEEPAEEPKLLCETEEHSHTADCYTLNCDGHVHSEACYTLNCEEDHTHTDECYVLHCEEGHTHTADCYTLTCGMEEHTHDENCYAPVHQHTEACYQFEYNCQSPSVIQIESENMLRAVDVPTTQNLSSLLTSVVVIGADLIDGIYYIEAQQDYTVKLKFQEQDGLEFNMDEGCIYFPLPAGIHAENASGTVIIGLKTSQGFIPIEHTYSIADNTLYIYWNSDDPDFADLAAAHKINIDFNITVQFDGTRDEVKFGDANDTTVNIATTGSITITKDVTGLADGLLTDDAKAEMRFELHDASGTVLKTFTYLDMVNGSVTYEEMKPGKYTVVETSHPDFPHYTFDTTDSVTSQAGHLTVPKNLNLALKNDYEVDKGSLKLTKNVNWTNWDGSTNMPDDMKGKIAFTITGPNGYSKTVSYAEFQDGALTLSDLAVGEYTVTEKNAITGYTWTYKVNNAPSDAPSAGVEVTKDGMVEVDFDNTYVQQTGDLVIKKTASGAAVPDSTQFKVTYPDGTVRTFTYSQMTDGRYTLTNVPLGTYAVEEVDGTGNVANYTLTVTGEGNYTLSQKNNTATAAIHNEYTPVGSLTINKTFEGLPTEDLTDAQIKAMMAVTFDVYNADNQKVASLTYADIRNGNNTIRNLPVGQYTVKERNAAIPGYTLDIGSGKDVTVNLAQGDSKTASFTNSYTKNDFKLTVMKQFADGSLYDIDSLPDNIKENTTFTITDKNGRTVKSCTLAELETALKGLDMNGPGPYTVTEKNPNVAGIGIYTKVSIDGDFKDGTSITVTLENHNPTTVTFENNYVSEGLIKGDKTVTGLYDYEERELRSKLRFNIYREDGTLVKGNVTLAQLEKGIKVPAGNYYVQETTYGVEGYTGPIISTQVGEETTSNDTTVHFPVTQNGETTVHFTNAYDKDTSDGGSVGIVKYVSGLDGLTGEGILTSSLNKDLYDRITFKLEELRGNPGKYYTYGTYTLADFAGGKKIALRPGTYRITELNGDVQNYRLHITYTIGSNTYTGNPIVFTVEENTNLLINVHNTYTKLGSLKIIKNIQGYDNSLTKPQQRKIIFEVYNAAEEKVASLTYFDILNGNGTITNLPVGTYTIKEVANNIDDDYACTVNPSPAIAEVTVEHGQTVSVTFTNSYVRKVGSLTVKKVMAGDVPEPLSDEQMLAMTFEVIRGNETAAGPVSYKDFVNGAYTFDNLPTGTYTVKEVIGGVLSNSYQIDVTSDKSGVAIPENGTAEITITNTFTEFGALKLSKVFDGVVPNEIGSSLTFTVQCDNPKYSKTISYSEFVNGAYTIQQLIPGTYTVTETDSTTGYNHTTQVKVGDEDYSSGANTSVTISSGITSAVTFENTYEEFFHLKIVKKLGGVLTELTADQKAAIRFTVKNADGDAVAAFTYADMTAEGGSVVYTVDVPEPGIYTVTEAIVDPDHTLFGKYDLATEYVIGTAKAEAGQEAEIELTRGENLVAFTNTYSEIPLLNVEKSSSQTKVGLVEKDGKQYPIWRFTLNISNLNPKTAGGSTTTFTDNFDSSHADWFRLAATEEVRAVDEEAENAYVLISKEDEKPAPAAVFDGSTITISGITDETAEKCEFIYYLIVKDEDALEKINAPAGENTAGVSHSFRNTVTYSPWPGDPDGGSTDAEYEYKFSAVDKDITNLDESGRLYQIINDKKVYVERASYSITLNKDGVAIGDENPITATDRFSENQTILLSTIKVTPEEKVSYTLDNENHTITFTLPNCTPVEISYETTISGQGEVKLTNAIDLCGFSNGVATVVSQTTQGEGSGTLYALTLVKTDHSDNSKRLDGAEFTLYDGITNEALTTVTTDENGLVFLETWQVGSGKDDSFKVDYEYYLVETKAPTGYQLPAAANNEIWFKFSDDFSGTDENGVKILRNGGELIVSNEPITVTLEVTKSFNRWDKQDSFSFKLSAVDSAPMPADGGEIAIASKGTPATFGKIYLNGGIGTYHYNIQEVVENPVPGIIYDTAAHPVTVVVADDNGDGIKEITVTYDEGKPSLTVTNTYESISVSGSKTWDDDNDRDGKRPDSITIHLYADGKKIESKTVTAADNWSWEFTDLPKHNHSGQEEIVYTITEDHVKGYTTRVNGYNVTNSYTPEKTSISGRKTWKDAHNLDHSRPRTITVNLLKNGEKIDSKFVSGPNWSFVFDNLPKYEDGKPITYTISEDKVRGYTTVITGDAEFGFEITNTHTPRRWRSWLNPRTGDTSAILLWVSLLLLSGTGIFMASVFGKKKGKYQR